MNIYSTLLQLYGPSKGGFGYLFIFIIFLILSIILLVLVEKLVKKRDERTELNEDEKNRKVIEKIMEVYKPSKEISDIEDNPQSFGYKTTWLAVRTTDQRALANEIGLKNVQLCNWESGIKYASYKSIFVTPLIGEWTLVVGDFVGFTRSNSDHQIQRKLIEKLSASFGEAQYFGSHRVSDYYYWMKAENGKLSRSYGTAEDAMEYGEGELTELEKTLNLRDGNSPEAKLSGYDDREDLISPDEELVLQIAENWSINSSKLDEMTGIKGLGLLGELP